MNRTNRTATVFLGVFFLGLCAGGYQWMSFPIVDERLWASDAHKVAEGENLTDQDLSYVHPGTTIVYPVALLIAFGISPETALRIYMTLITSLGIAGIAAISYVLQPSFLWWLTGAVLLLGDIRLLHATPPSALAALIGVLIFLLLWLWHEKRLHAWKIEIALGVLLGIMIATRIDTGLFFLVAFGIYFVLMSTWSTARVLPLALGVAFISTPHLWSGSTSYVGAVLFQMERNIGIVGSSSIILYFENYIFVLLSMALSLGLFFQNMLRIPHVLYAWLFLTTSALTVLLFLSPFYPMRYFLPVYLIWDTLLLFFLTMYTLRISQILNLPWLTPRKVEWILVGGLVLKISLMIAYWSM